MSSLIHMNIKEVTEYTSFKGEARKNPLYAARLFFKQMGIPAENKNDLQSIGHKISRYTYRHESGY